MTSSVGSSADIIKALEDIHVRIKRIHRELRPSDRIVADLGIDSLGAVEILLSLEEQFGVSLLDEPRTARIQTIGDLVDLLMELGRRTPHAQPAGEGMPQ